MSLDWRLTDLGMLNWVGSAMSTRTALESQRPFEFERPIQTVHGIQTRMGLATSELTGLESQIDLASWKQIDLESQKQTDLENPRQIDPVMSELIGLES
jgi:hypothetical protein